MTIESYDEINVGDYVRGVFESQNRYLYYPDARYYKLLLIWIVHVDIFKMFPCTPILQFQGEHDSGKSNSIKYCAGMVNRFKYLANYTAASLRNEIGHNNDRAFFLDEQPTVFPENILTLLRVGAYSSGGTIQVAGKRTGEVHNYNVFAPKAFATYYHIKDPALESRCVTLFTKKTLQYKELADVNTLRIELKHLREMQSLILKQQRERIGIVYAGLRVPELGASRHFQIFRVLLSIATVFDEICPGYGFYDSILQIGVAQKDRLEAERDLSNIESTAFAEALLWYMGTYQMDREGGFYRLDRMVTVLRGADPRYSGWRVEDLSKGLKKHKFVIKASRPRFEDPNDSNRVLQATCVVFDVEKLNAIAHSGQN